MMTIETETEQGRLDLTLSRVIAAPRSLIWRVWTDPEHLKKWWTPKPVETIACEMDLRPGGAFRTVMRLPDGTEHPTNGAFLELVEPSRIVFTDALEADFRPTAESFMTAIISLEDHPEGTLYTARVLHKSDADRKKHEEMGFHQGWGTALDQLVELVIRMKGEGN